MEYYYKIVFRFRGSAVGVPCAFLFVPLSSVLFKLPEQKVLPKDELPPLPDMDLFIYGSQSTSSGVHDVHNAINHPLLPLSAA